MTWSGMVSSADMALTSLEEGIEWQGEASVQRLVLETGDDRWLDGRMVRCAIDGRLEGDDVRMNLTEAALGDGQVEVPLSGQLTSDDEGFSLALTSERYAVSAAEATLPPPCRRHWLRSCAEWRGKRHWMWRLVVFRKPPRTGPEDGDWNGVWAVRVEPKGLSRMEDAGRIDWTGGRLEAFSVAKGWRASAPALAVSLAGGEFAGGAEVRESAGRMELGIAGPRGVPSGWSLAVAARSGRSALDRAGGTSGWTHRCGWFSGPDVEGGHLDLVGRGPESQVVVTNWWWTRREVHLVWTDLTPECIPEGQGGLGDWRG